MDEKYRREILSCVEKCMQTEHFSKMNIDLIGTNEKGEGFLADFIFATVAETDKDQNYKEVHLALKIGKRGKGLRENNPAVIECYARESFLYDTVLPTFHQFQLERDILNVFDAVPKCYGTVLSDDIEALVLEDLKRKGFVLHDKLSTMNLQHLHLVLKNYAKFHALSFAFRDQHKDEFDKVTANYNSVLRKMCASWFIAETDPKVLMVLREEGRDDLAAKYLEKTKNDELACLLAILDDGPQESVILHGDCHNNNFLFEYECNEMSRMGGCNLYEFIKRCMYQLISNSLASTYSYHGRRNKKRFVDLKIASLLLCAAEKAYYEKTTKKEIEDSIMKWLRRASERK